MLTGESITVQVRGRRPRYDPQGQVTGSADEIEEAGGTQEDSVLEAASVANTLLLLEGVAAEGRNWFRGRD
jgi:hypothetical protein